MKHRSTQLDRRQTPDSLRVLGSRTVVNSSAGVEVEEGSDSKVRYEACFPPRMRVFELPLSHRESAVRVVSKSNSNQRQADEGIEACEAEHRRSRGKWSVSPLWEAKILLGVLRQQGLAGKGLVKAFEKWAPRVAGRSRTEMNRVYREQTGREMSDYILVQQADKVVRYNQLPPEAEVVRRALLSPDSSRVNGHNQPEQAENPAETKGAFRLSKQHLLDEHDPNVLLSTNELASLTGFRPKTIRRWVSRKLLNYIRVGNRLRFRLAAVELFLAQREVRK
ncbi:MAG: helix-turn-helix domain-containing protein [Candidatus Acidiferrum sp.]